MGRWDGIEEMVAITAAGSFAGAAASLGVSTSHVSRAIARLEANVQAPVFLRTTRRIRLTETGRALLDRFQHILNERDEALASANISGEPQGELRLTCSTALGEHFVAPIVREYAQAHPRLSVTLHFSNHIVDLIAEGFDLAIRTGQLSDSRLTRTRIAARRYYLCAAPDYLDRRGVPASIEALDEHDCLVGASGIWHFARDGRDHAVRPTARWRCNSGIATAEAALAAFGICQLPEFYVADHIRQGRLVALLEANRPADEPVWAVYPQRRHLTPKVRLLVDRLRQQLEPALGGEAAVNLSVA